MADSNDQSHLDAKYFIDPHVYNCPYCNRRHVSYSISHVSHFDWTADRLCFIYTILCASCRNESMHLSFENLVTGDGRPAKYRGKYDVAFRADEDIDSKIFYSVPTSFFVLDQRIPKIIRELITEAEGSRKMNFLTGASACARKAIYEFLVKEKAEGEHYDDKIKSLKAKFPSVDAELFDVLGHIQDMTSDKVHEQSWPKWDSGNLTLIIETLKAVLHEVYVVPQEKSQRSGRIRELLQRVRGESSIEPPAATESKEGLRGA